MNDFDPNTHADIPSDERLPHLLLQSPLQEPPPWFIPQTIARLKRETVLIEKRGLQWIWAGVAALACLLIVVGIEIREQSNNEIFSIVSLDSNNANDDSEELWLEQ